MGVDLTIIGKHSIPFKNKEIESRGRLSRSSVEVFVINMERRAKHVKFHNNKQPQGMIDYEETESQPIRRPTIVTSVRN